MATSKRRVVRRAVTANPLSAAVRSGVSAAANPWKRETKKTNVKTRYNSIRRKDRGSATQ